MNIQDAISAPNMLNRFGKYELKVSTKAEQFKADLEKLGYTTDVRELNSGVQAIVIDGKGLTGAADPRREGLVMGE